MKKLLILLVTCFLTLSVVGCSGGNGASVDDLPDWADQKQLIAQAQEVINSLNDRDYDAIADKFVKVKITGEELKQSIDESLTGFGEFKGYGEAALAVGDDGGDTFVAVYQATNYENVTVTYQVNFFEDGTLAGFFAV